MEQPISKTPSNTPSKAISETTLSETISETISETTPSDQPSDTTPSEFPLLPANHCKFLRTMSIVTFMGGLYGLKKTAIYDGNVSVRSGIHLIKLLA